MADRGVGANPLSHIFQAIGEPLPLVKYNKWNVLLPEGEFLTRVGATQFLEVLQEVCICNSLMPAKVDLHTTAPAIRVHYLQAYTLAIALAAVLIRTVTHAHI